MDDEKYPVYKEKFSVRLLHYIQDIWPSIYRVVNSFIFGAIEFFKDTISTIWRGF